MKTYFTIFSSAEQRRSYVHQNTKRLPHGSTASTSKWRTIKPEKISECVTIHEARAQLYKLGAGKGFFIQYPPQMEMAL